MIASILIPTRNRPGELALTIEYLVSKSSDPTSYELLLYVDRDDIKTQKSLPSIYTRYPDMKILTCLGTRPPDAYAGLYTLYNELFSLSSGEFIFIYNDDVQMTSAGWDDVLREYTNKICIIHVHNNTPDNSNIFPIVHRKIPETLGYFGLHSSIDVQYDILGKNIAGLIRDEPRITCIHGMGCESEHIKDNYPNTNPQGIYGFRDQLVHDATKLRQELNL